MTPTAVCVDDSAVELGVIRRILETIGVQVVGTATNGGIGMDLIREHQPTLALLDIVLPEMTGIEILEAVQREGLPTVVVMASSMSMLKKRAAELGARFFVVKPYDDLITSRELKGTVAEIQAQRDG